MWYDVTVAQTEVSEFCMMWLPFSVGPKKIVVCFSYCLARHDMGLSRYKYFINNFS